MNTQEKDQIKNKLKLSKQAKSGYGFIDWNKMPNGNYISNSINYKDINWVKTRDLKHGINHCGATAVTNIVLYFANKGYTNLKADKSEYDTFTEIHKRIKNGPVVNIANKTKQYFSERGYRLKYSKVSSFDSFRMAIDKDRPCAVILSASLFNWHWILAVGWRIYDSGEKYIQIVDGWNGNANRFYKIDSTMPFVLSTQYWIE